MKNIKYLFLSLLTVVFCALNTSCELEDINIDPTRPNDVDLKLILPTMLTQAAYNQSAISARVPGIIMQQFEGFDAQQIEYTNYLLNETVFNGYWNTGAYAGVLKDCRVIIDKATETGQIHYEAIAKIVMAETYGMLASFFGDVPFSQALKGTEVLKPSYDTQEQVYAGVQSLLDEAIALLSKPSPVGGPANDDLIYKGNAANWTKTAYALKARYAMLLSKRDQNAATKALQAIQNSYKSLTEQSTFSWENTQIGNNPLAKFGVERPNTMVTDKRFGNALKSRMDPRLTYFTVEVAANDFKYFQSGNTRLVWSKNDAKIPLISFVELKFLEAEALARTGGSDADVSARLKEGITANMQQIGIAAADYQAYVDANSNLTGLSTDQKIKKIIEEAYYAYYGQAFQQIWTNYLRTGYPALTPSPIGANGLNPSGVIPRRFIYPQNENLFNKENVDAAKARQNGALLDANTWAFN